MFFPNQPEFVDGVTKFFGDGSVRTQILKLCGFNTGFPED